MGAAVRLCSFVWPRAGAPTAAMGAAAARSTTVEAVVTNLVVNLLRRMQYLGD
ncbi:hypothetical protein GCM10014715_04200 [Streptomyces spiralis]|uniref:Uncharacterized protein n=1 Tax=Streptomyces spiralis TaxID=66376 RepID=A0A918ZIB6_9ACTN|nr:hypothetical protein GCM10014715_04200 [Streptomyces spiralis]